MSWLFNAEWIESWNTYYDGRILPMGCGLCPIYGRDFRHTATLRVGNTIICTCCWFEHAFGPQAPKGAAHARRVAVCGGEPFQSYVRSSTFERDVWEYRSKVLKGYLEGTPG